MKRGGRDFRERPSPPRMRSEHAEQIQDHDDHDRHAQPPRDKPLHGKSPFPDVLANVMDYAAVPRGQADERVKVQDSVARLLRAPPYAARRKGLGFDLSNCLRSQSDRSTVVVGNCTFCTDNGGGSPGQSITPLDVRRSCFGPMFPQRGFLVEPPGTAPGSDPRITSAFMSIVRLAPDIMNIGRRPRLRNRNHGGMQAKPSDRGGPDPAKRG